MATKGRGFTVVEILAVMVVIALGCSMGVFAVYQQLDSTSLHSAGYLLLHVVEYANLLARQMDRPCELHIDMDNRTFRLAVHARNNYDDTTLIEAGRQPGTVMIHNPYERARELPEKVHFSKIRVEDETHTGKGQAVIIFRGDGTAQAALININVADESKTIVVMPHTGRSQLRQGAVNELPTEIIDLQSLELQGPAIFLE